MSYSNLGACLENNGQYQEAVIHFRKALDILISAGYGNNSQSAYIYDRLAMIFYKYLHDDETAVAYLEKAFFLYQNLNLKKDAADVQFGLKKLNARISMKSSLTKYSGTLFRGADESDPVVTQTPAPQTLSRP